MESHRLKKKELTEADIRTKFITPAIVGANGEKWDVMTQLREEIYFTKGRVIVRGKTVKRGEAKKADYLLFYRPNIPLAVVEAKENYTDGGIRSVESLDILKVDPLTAFGTPVEIVRLFGGKSNYLAAICELETELYSKAA